ncbi:MAG: CBS domain-containing protein [Nanoarchaeota archaeon]
MTPPAASHTLDEIKRLRRKFHLNQKELAGLAGVSQSLIAKIEAGKIDPSFTRAQQIFQALEQLRDQKEVKARQLMNVNVFFTKRQEAIKEVIKKMKVKSISQMPVLERGRVVGIISEGIILNKIAESPQKVSSLLVEEVMAEAPPIVSLATGLRTLMELLREYPIVLVAEKGEIKGIISKTDVLGKVE